MAFDSIRRLVTMLVGRVTPGGVKAVQIVSATKTITSETVKGLAEYLRTVYRSEYKTKADALEMIGVSSVLSAMGVLDADAFMRDYTTTIGRTVYLPFVVGEASERFPLWSQIKILTHEHQHIVQLDREGAERFAYYYLGDRDKRAAYEAEAYSTAFELERYAGLPLSSPEYLASKLAAYGCAQGQIDYAAGLLRSYRATVESGGCILDAHAARTACEWLQLNA